ncbi:type II toxin-antitoxin system PemK/MazF family toxin [Bacteroidota bacterium]
MKEGDIVLATLITSEGAGKKRPVLILKILPKYKDLLICGISTQIHQFIDNFDLMIYENSEDYLSSGLIKTSLVRLGYLSVIPQKFIEGKLGNISQESQHLLIKRLCNYLLKS